MSHRPRWLAAEVSTVAAETSSARSLVLNIPGWAGHIAGQHVDIRLTAPDGYQAARSYSLSSGPDEPPQITVERVDGGEVSPYLVDIAQPGDRLEARGPLGGYFIWQPEDRELVLIGGGSGIAPLRAMWRAGAPQTHVLYSARTADRVIFAEELSDTGRLTATIHLTREDRPGYRQGRVGVDAMSELLSDIEDPAIYVCGPTSFVESIATHLGSILGAQYPIRTERFG